MDEMELVSGLKLSNERAKSIFYQKYYPQIYKYINASFGRKLTEHEVSDIATDTILRGINKIDKYEFKAPLINWLLKISSRTAFDYLEKIKSIKHSMISKSVELSPSENTDEKGIDTKTEEKDLLTKFRKTLSKLENKILDLIISGHTQRNR